MRQVLKKTERFPKILETISCVVAYLERACFPIWLARVGMTHKNYERNIIHRVKGTSGKLMESF
jgi:hypothetical protein